MTLRKLVWMSAERKRVSGQLVAWGAAVIVSRIPLSGERLNPDQINPFRGSREADTAARLASVKAFIAGRGLAMFGQ